MLGHAWTLLKETVTAFIGSALRGPTELPGSVNSFADFERLYGGLWAQSTLGYAVQQFFLNGGSIAIIVRVFTRSGAQAAKAVRLTTSPSWVRPVPARLPNSKRRPWPRPGVLVCTQLGVPAMLLTMLHGNALLHGDDTCSDPVLMTVPGMSNGKNPDVTCVGCG